MSKEALILFVRKPELGKVKTRIAATEGETVALTIYQRLLEHTYSITAALPVDKYVFYAGEIEKDDTWSLGYHKLLQDNTDLGNRMKAAFTLLFHKGYDRICIIGSDCYELDELMIQQAFATLTAQDIVIGPAKDGGYYLLGMRQELRDIFQNIEWSTENVLQQTIDQINALGSSYYLLPYLNDVDTIDDVPMSWKEEIVGRKS